MNRFCFAINLSSFIIACFKPQNNQLHVENYLGEIYVQFQLKARTHMVAAIINDCIVRTYKSTPRKFKDDETERLSKAA